MAYQHYNRRHNENREHNDGYMPARNPSQQSVRFRGSHDNHAYPSYLPQQKPHQDYATYGYSTQTKHSNMSQDRYNDHTRVQHQFEHDGFTTDYSTSDYIFPPVESRHDYILPQYSTTQRRQSQREPSHEDRRYYGEQNKTPRFQEQSSSVRAVHADKSNHQVLKESGFDNKHDFMRSYGIKPGGLDAYDQANDILDSFRHIDAHHHRSQKSQSQPNRAQPGRPRSSQHRYGDPTPVRHTSNDRKSDMETCIDSDVPEREYLSDSGSDIASYKSNASLDRYWSRSPSFDTRNLSETEYERYRSVSQSPAGRWGDASPYLSERVHDIESDRDGPRTRYVSASPRSRRYSSTSIRSRRSPLSIRSRSSPSVAVRSSGSSVLSFRSRRSGLGSEFEVECGRGRFKSGTDSGSDSVLSVESSSNSESGSEIESMDEYDDDYMDDGWDEEVDDGTEYDDY